MGARQFGALPRQAIHDFCTAGFITGVNLKDISPASVDLELSAEAYRVDSVTLPRPGEKVRDLLPLMQAEPHKLPHLLERNVNYLVCLKQSLKLPKGEGYYGFCNPKSSTGRLDIHVRVLADGMPRYDSVPKDYHGELWLYITTRSFAVKVNEGEALTQLRLFNADTRLSRHEMVVAYNQYQFGYALTGEPLPFEQVRSLDSDGALQLTLMLAEEGKAFGYRCRVTSRIIDLSARNIDPSEYFEPAYVYNGAARLAQGEFLIGSTAESIRIPPGFAAEMVAIDERFGEIRAHYAGFLDPGWGWGTDGEGRGRPFTLEMRPYETLTIRAGQPIAKIRFERMLALPDVVYDSSGRSHYVQQDKPRLAKQFAPWPE